MFRIVLKYPWRGYGNEYGDWTNDFLPTVNNLRFNNPECLQRRIGNVKHNTAAAGAGGTAIAAMSFYRGSAAFAFIAQAGNELFAYNATNSTFSAMGASLNDSCKAAMVRAYYTDTNYHIVSQANTQTGFKKWDGSAFTSLALTSYTPTAVTLSSLGTIVSSYGSGFMNCYINYGVTYEIDGIESVAKRTELSFSAAGGGAAIFSNGAAVKLRLTASDSGSMYYPVYSGAGAEANCKLVKIYRTQCYGAASAAAAARLFFIGSVKQGETNKCDEYTDDVNTTAGDFPDMWLDEQNPYNPDIIYQSPPKCAEFLCWHNGQLWALGSPDYPSRLYRSLPNLPQYWLKDDYIDVNLGDTSNPTGVIEYNKRLFVFKENSIYEIVEQGNGWNWRLIDGAIGCIAKNSLCQGNDMVFFQSYRGIEVFTGSVGPKPLSLRFKRLFEEMPAEYRVNIAMGFNDNRLYVSYPPAGATTNTKTLVYDLDSDTWEHNDYGFNVFCTNPPGGANGDMYMLAGSTSGYVWHLEYAGLSCAATMKTGWLHSPARLSNLTRNGLLYFNTNIASGGQIDINIYLDGGTTTAWSISMTNNSQDGVFRDNLDVAFEYIRFEVNFNNNNTADKLYEIGLEADDGEIGQTPY